MFSRDEEEHIVETKRILYAKMKMLLGQFPEVLRDFLTHNSILTGGSIATHLLHAGEPNDYDLYLNSENHILFFKQYVTNMDKEFIQDADEKYYDVSVPGKLVTANATTFKNRIQVVTIHNSNVRNTFDFVHCMPWYDIAKNKLHISYNQYDSISLKKLIKNEHPNAFPLSGKRVDKYNARGWKF